MKTQRILDQELEQISSLEPKSSEVKLSLKAQLRKVWRGLVAALYQKPEPQVRRTLDRAGNVWWNVYNPATDESTSFGSEQAVRIWLEQSYYKR